MYFGFKTQGWLDLETGSKENKFTSYGSMCKNYSQHGLRLLTIISLVYQCMGRLYALLWMSNLFILYPFDVEVNSTLKFLSFLEK